MVLKGPPLAVLIHGYPGGRTSGDLDLLIHPKDFDRTLECLRNAGYREDEPVADLRASRADKHVLLRRQNPEIAIEVHWSPYTPNLEIRDDIAGFWARSQFVEIAGQRVRVPSIEDTIVYLCLHGRIHRWTQIKWICDIAYLMGCKAPWGAAMEHATRLGYRRTVIVAIEIASRLLGARIPEEIQAACSGDEVAGILADSIITDLDQPDSTQDYEDALHEAIRYEDGTWARLRFLGRKIFHAFRPNLLDDQEVPLPARLRALHVFTRPLRLYRTYGFRWLRGLR